MSEYRNQAGRRDTYWRKLPETDDPETCMEYLLDWWRSKRITEYKRANRIEGPNGATGLDDLTAEALITAEEEAIEALLDDLAGTKPTIRTWASRRVAEAASALDAFEDFGDTETAASSASSPEDPHEWLTARRELAEALSEWKSEWEGRRV